MTAVETSVATGWGVRYCGFGHCDQVFPCEDAAAALRRLEALLFCGNKEARLVSRLSAGVPWVLVSGVVCGQMVVDGWSFTHRMRTAEVAALFRVDTRTVERWADRGRLTVLWTLGREHCGHRRFSAQQVEYLAAGGAL